MTIEELKSKIEHNTVASTMLIFVCASDKFIAQQYYRQIAKDKGLKIEVIDDLHQLQAEISDVWGTNSHSNSLLIYNTDTFETDIANLFEIKNLVVVCNKISDKIKSLYSSYIINVPKLEEWQIRDYVYSQCEYIETKKLDWIIDICDKDIYRIQNEIEKLTIMDSGNRDKLFESYVQDGVYNDLSNKSVFDLTNAIIKRDKNALIKAYLDKDKYEISEMGFFTILYNGFKNVINIQLAVNPTPELCGLKPNQFKAISYNIGRYSKDELLKIFSMLTSIDKKIKTGEIEISSLIDYLIVDIFNN